MSPRAGREIGATVAEDEDNHRGLELHGGMPYLCRNFFVLDVPLTYSLIEVVRYCIADMSRYKQGKVHGNLQRTVRLTDYFHNLDANVYARYSTLVCFAQIGLRWRTEKEVVSGKGQFICGNKKCNEKDGLGSYEVNFSYLEAGENKQALVKLVACKGLLKLVDGFHFERCAEKLAYRRQKERECLKDNDRDTSKRKRHELNLFFNEFMSLERN
ncbi:hypothetical protein GW17_00001229 [Ensete ventricosum]|nr:hypothetical protein GW17_00001229 [Ensete ventricosum]